ncbi:MAG TPA: dihydropteroate synthase [Paracoccaceae bacterium]|nr:dihydropteroate synthase [Paracoccaceae bacterium]
MAAGIARDCVLIDPGIGFGKTAAHNIALLRGLRELLALGFPVLVGLSRKRFVGTITGVDRAADRVAGSLAGAIFAAARGAAVIRVHDAAETRQALAMMAALEGG